jgi:hypothetical protein
MKLSEAIRLGAMNSPQGFEFMLSPDGSRCALGAAADAGGFPLHVHQFYAPPRMRDYWPILLDMDTLIPCPSCGVSRFGWAEVIIHLNDGHQWTREQTADWVESQEALAAPRTVAAVGQPEELPHLSTRA